MKILEAAKAYTAAGISVIPIKVDGSKAPACPWKEYQERIATADELQAWFGNGTERGIAVLGGHVSGGLEILDFDEPGLIERWAERVDREAPALLARLPRVRTPSGGDHVFIRSDNPAGNQKLAMTPTGVPGKFRVLIETRGEGGYVLTRPSPPGCHPAGRTYDPTSPIPLSAVPLLDESERDVLLEAARAFDERPLEDAIEDLPPARPDSPAAVTFREACERYNADHARDWRAVGGPKRVCPVCGHKGCFGPLPKDPSRWACFSTNHGGAGIEGPGCYHGDALDVDAHAEGVDHAELLRRGGYLGTPSTPPPPPPPDLRVVPPPPDDGAPPHGEPPDEGRPSWQYVTGEGDRAVQFALGVLADVDNVYHRARKLARVARVDTPEDGAGVTRDTGAPVVVNIPRPMLWEIMSREADWLRWDARKREEVRREPPSPVITALHERGDYPGIREITGVVTVPVLRPDGTIHDRPGYDQATGLVYVRQLRLPELPAKPSRDDAQRALSLVMECAHDFPFASDACRAGWLAAFLSPLAFTAYRGGAPMFVFDASTPGTGKTLCADVVGMVASGQRMPRSPYVKEDDELRKRITSHAIAGDTLALIDNVPSGGFIGWPCLDMALTATAWVDRVLGKSENVRMPLNLTWYATGNNVGVRADAARRVMRIRLETNLERPEERTGFRHDPLLEWVRAKRPELLSASLTILRAFFEAGAPTQGLAPLGSFEGWSDLVRCCVVWLGFTDPVEALAARDPDADPDASLHRRLLLAWAEAEGLASGLSAKDALIAAERTGGETLREVLIELCGTRKGDLPTPRRLGTVLRKFRGRRRQVENHGRRELLQFVAFTDRNGVAVWRVESEIIP